MQAGRPNVASPPASRRSIRSRSGCLTCKRRKVKCNEQHPRCSHCERLNIECVWNNARRVAGGQSSNRGQHLRVAQQDASTAWMLSDWNLVQPLSAVTESFGYDEMMQDTNGQSWSQAMQAISDPAMGLEDVFDSSTLEWNGRSSHDTASDENATATELPLPYSRQDDETSHFPNDELMDFFIHSISPPILEDVEARKKWLIIRRAIVEMARKSTMVKSAVSAFSALLMARKGDNGDFDDQTHYQKASEDVKAFDSITMAEYSRDREHVLVVLFFLCYIDILGVKMERAHLNLKRAYTIFQRGQSTSFSSTERQILLWIRLLDARAVSAGGEGLFLADDNDTILTESSPSHNEYETASPDGQHSIVEEESVEDVLFQTLYQPGLVFFQKVQSFSGRISKIDPWHRSRGTVEDEIEVVNIGATIASGLTSLYTQRPVLMDLAVAGKLMEPHLSANLASSITRTFRTYLSNFYACRVHLHRVAYKTLPLTKDAEDALQQIRSLAHQIVEDLGPADNLPVTMLWPLLMLGAEESDLNERLWIKDQILRMENVAGNAHLTTKVLEEVQTRQDAAKARVDIRSVMQSVFHSCFAIV